MEAAGSYYMRDNVGYRFSIYGHCL